MGLGQLFGGMGRTPPIIIVIAAATFVLSIVGTIGMRHGFPLALWAALVPDAVAHGQLWRVFTWVLFEVDHPFNLVFACLALYWFGRDLALRWGPLRFLAFYFGLASLVGAIVVGISRVYPVIGAAPYLGSWPLQEAIIILWATFYPTRQIMVYFVLPLGGRALVVLTVAGTVLFSMYYGIEMFIPHFLAEAIVIAWAAVPSPSEAWTEHKLRSMEQKRRATHLRSIPREGPRDGGPHEDPPKGDGPSSGRWLN
jgi:membrane associated rhomboid family serine protease